MKICERCGKKFKCAADRAKVCWCSTFRLSKATLAEIKSQYRDCLCRECVAEYAARDAAIKTQKDNAPRNAPAVKKKLKKGLLIVHTGGGKGKSTAAFGTALRALGHGKKVVMVRFLKGKWESGE